MSQNGSISDDKTPGEGLIQGIADWIADVGGVVIDGINGLGSIALFTFDTFLWLTTRMVRRETLIQSLYEIGVQSLFVVVMTGGFIGIILAVQTYGQFRFLHMESRLGAVIGLSLLRELGPVLAATMLAGRVGGAMAAELGTMRVTEQIDALASMGTNPIHYLVVPRFLGCLLMIPALTIVADLVGILGGAVFSLCWFDIDWYPYFIHLQQCVRPFDLIGGVFKSLFFGAAISLISCYYGFHCDAGAEGVGRAATTAFVRSFVVILMLDLVLAIGLESVYLAYWPEGPKLL